MSDLPKEWRYHRNHSNEDMLTDPYEGRFTRSGLRKMMGSLAFVSHVEPKVFNEAKYDENWMLAM